MIEFAIQTTAGVQRTGGWIVPVDLGGAPVRTSACPMTPRGDHLAVPPTARAC